MVGICLSWPNPSGAVWVATACRGRDETVRGDNGWMAMKSPFVIALSPLDESVLCARARSSTPFAKLVAEVMTTEPYASARRVFWVVDNGSSHNGVRSIERMQTTWPTATLVHLPVHASWLNQVEIYFSILQRKAISPNDFADLNQLSERIMDFQDRYNTTATPFDWTYTRDDLNAFLHRLDLHDTPHAA